MVREISRLCQVGRKAMLVPCAMLVCLFVSGPAAFADLIWDRQTVDVSADVDQSDVEVVFTFTNAGQSEVELRNIRSSCGCTTATPSKKVYRAGESGILRVRVTIGNADGPVSRTVVVETNEQETDRYLLVTNVLVPVVVECQPTRLYWSAKDTTPQTIAVFIKRQPYRIKDVEIRNGQEYKLEMIKENELYRLTVQPPRKGVATTITLTTDCVTKAGLAKVKHIQQVSTATMPE